MARAIHSTIRVADLDRSLRFYADVLGLHEAHRFDFPDAARIGLRAAGGGDGIALTLSQGRDAPGEALSARGHLGVVVDDARAAREALAAKGYDPAGLGEIERDGQVLARAFLIHDPDGHPIEFLERQGRYP